MRTLNSTLLTIILLLALMFLIQQISIQEYERRQAKARSEQLFNADTLVVHTPHGEQIYIILERE